MTGSPDPDQFWAKLRYRDDDPSTGEIVEWHPLTAHSADVAAVTEALLTRTILRDRLARLAGLDDLTPAHIARLSALAALHDAGKANHGFQDQAFTSGWSPGHVRPMVELLGARSPESVARLQALGIMQIVRWFADHRDPETDLFHTLLATFGHHGKPVSDSGDFRLSLWEANENRNPTQALENLAARVESWFPDAYGDADVSFPDDPAFQHAFNGVLTLADWIGSDRRYFPFMESTDDYIRHARKQAAEAVEANFLDPSTARAALGTEPVGFDGVLEEPNWNPYPIQEAVYSAPIHEEGSLAILESDTGSGKTEAALARFLQLYQNGLVDGMYFAVPTRSAATQLYGRVQEAVDRVFDRRDAPAPPVVQAVPGYLKADAVEGVPLPQYDVRWPDDPTATARERRWAAEHSKRYLAGPIVVGTVDQVLLSVLQTSHAHMRASALLRHFLVVDEIHASDTYMTRLLGRVLDQHLEAGGHALLMSATLGTAARVRLATDGAEDPSDVENAQQVDYPLLTHVGADRENPRTRHEPSTEDEKTVRAECRAIADSPEEVARRAIERAREGARVLVIRNRVADCIATQKALEAQTDDRDLLFGVDGMPAPHHSRFAPDDRKRLDAAIENTFGAGTDAGAVVAVATQTVEQSLDIDADLLLTDLCPIDVLLQRIGRLHRHDRDRPDGFETARCLVLTPQERDLGTAISGGGKAWKGDHGLGTVYQDLRILEATWQVLEDETLDPWQIPEDNRVLVERGTHPDRLHAIAEANGADWMKHEQYILGKEYADAETAGYVMIDRTEPFGQTEFASDLQAVKTRLGRDDYQVEFTEAGPGPFGESVGEMTVTEWQIDDEPEDTEGEIIRRDEDGFAFRFAGRRFRYDRFGLTVVQ